jgi:predicted phosphate transport protein (TIGR00153 family)
MVDFGFFSLNKKERRILAGAENHLGAVQKTVDAFAALLNSVGRNDPASTKRLFDEVLNGETEADTIHREFSLKIAEGAFFGGVREDMLELLEKIDSVADSAKDASRFLSMQGSMDAAAVGILMSETMQHFVSDLKGAVAALGRLLDAFEHSRKEALAKVHTVEEFEEAADASKDRLLRELFEKSTQMNPVSVIQLRDFIFVADDIADNAEDAGDVVLVLLAKGYG